MLQENVVVNDTFPNAITWKQGKIELETMYKCKMTESSKVFEVVGIDPVEYNYKFGHLATQYIRSARNKWTPIEPTNNVYVNINMYNIIMHLNIPHLFTLFVVRWLIFLMPHLRHLRQSFLAALPL